MTRADLDRGVPFALDADGLVAEPATAQHHERFYRCLVCGEHVFLKRGKVRVAHFAHYAKRETPCSTETALHEAAKRRLAERLREGLTTILVRVPCRGFTTAYNNQRDCPELAAVDRGVEVPAFEVAEIEVPFGAYRLDAAAVLAGRAVLGLEVFQSNAVDSAKQAFLTRSRLTWLEVRAHDVMREEMPWALLAGSPEPFQCSSCFEQAAEAARLRVELEAEDRRREAEERQRERFERFKRRNFRIAYQGRELVRPDKAQVGEKAKCLACKQELEATRINDWTYWSHAGGFECDPRLAWVHAGMLALFNQLKSQPEAIKVIRRCEGSRYRHCRAWLVDRLPKHDTVEGAGTSLVLRSNGIPVAQITFDEDFELAGAPWLMTVREPSRLLKDPATLIQQRDGRYCPTCAAHTPQRTTSAHRPLRVSQRQPEGHGAASVQQERLLQTFTRGHSREECDRALEVAREQLSLLAIDPICAAGYSVTLRVCGHCQQETVAIDPYGMMGLVPVGLDALLDDSSGPLRCKCAICGAIEAAAAAACGIPVSSARLVARPKPPS